MPDKPLRKVIPLARDANLAQDSAGDPQPTEWFETAMGSGATQAPDSRAAAKDTWAAAKVLACNMGKLARTTGMHAASGARQHLSKMGRSRRAPAPPSPTQGATPPRLHRRSWLFVRIIGAITASFLLLISALFLYCAGTLPIDGGLRAEATQSALTLQSDTGETFASRGVFKGEKLTGSALPPRLVEAVIAIEDRRFYQHWGIDPRGALRAAWRNLQAGGTREGGSTITQQLARLMFLSPERTLRRKAQEALLALWLESQLTKEEILVRYLNTAFFGAGAYGADAAAKRYFGKRAKDLSLSEAAMLAGLVRAPSQLAPTRNFGGAKERAETVLEAMVETGAITAKEAETARAQSVDLRTPPDTPPGTNYFVDMVTADLRRLLGSAPGDLTLRTTMNLELQRLAEGVIERRLETEGAKKNATQAALIAMRPDGGIVALVGGRDYDESQFNRATQARRQAGSLFKLFVYLTAFQKGYTPQSVLVDRPIQIGEWEPQNASGGFRGSVSLRAAFAQSINTIAVQLAEKVGVAAIAETAKRMGVQSNLPLVPSLALGSGEVTLMEMTRAFAAVSAGVETIEPYAIRAIGGPQQSLYTRANTGPEVTGQLGESRAMMLELLQAVVTEGTGKAARLPNTPVVGKTGTSQEYRDAWFIGFTPDLVVGVWVGNDDNSPMTKVVGGDLPASIWRDFVGRAAPDKPRTSSVVQVSQPKSTGSVPQPASASIKGIPRVVDTGTIEIGGQLVRLHGVEGARGRMGSQLAQFLRRQEVTCEPTNVSEVYRCRLGGEDLSGLILAGGGARATADAAPELLAAEDQARAARSGVWRRGRE